MGRPSRPILTGLVPLVVVFLALVLATNAFKPTSFAIVPTDVVTAEQTLPPEIVASTSQVPPIETGTDFVVNNSRYANVSLDSTEPITLTLNAPPEMVEMDISSEAASSQLTISGLNPDTEYHMYVDSYHNHTPFTTNGTGSWSWEQDLSQNRFIWIQPRPSTFYLNITGGQCAPPNGTWDNTTKICILTTDLSETINFDDNNITLDCAGHNTTGSGTGYGFRAVELKNVTIKNCVISDYTTGMQLQRTNFSTITNNTVINLGDVGINLQTSSNNTISNNMLNCSNAPSPDANRGVYLMQTSKNNTIYNNTALFCNSNGIFLHTSPSNKIYNNTLTNNTKGIELTSTSSLNNITNNTIWNSTSMGISIQSDSPNNILGFNNIHDNHFGIRIDSAYNTLNNNTVNYNWDRGIELYLSSFNNITNNTVNYNDRYGIRIYSDANNNTLIYNTFNNNTDYGIHILSSSNNRLINNTATNNGQWDFYTETTSLNNEVINLISQQTLGMTTSKDVAIKGLRRHEAPTDKSGVINISKWVNVTNTSTDSWVWLNVSYTHNELKNVNESSLRIWRYNGTWDNSTFYSENGVDIVNNVVYANITGFSSTYAPLGDPQNITSCQNITSSGDWALSQNLTGNQSSGICIDIQAPNVTLDCAGFSINSSTGGDWTYGIYTNSSNTTVQNCYVQNYTYGVWALGGSYNNITNNTIYNGSQSIRLEHTNNVTVTNNTALNNRYYGILLDNTNFSNITNNTANYNIDAGIYLEYAANNTIANNTANYNAGFGGFGIHLHWSHNNTVINNTANYNAGWAGIVLESSNSSVINNTASYNTYSDGIQVRDSNGAVVINNTMVENHNHGIYLIHSTNTLVSDNAMTVLHNYTHRQEGIAFSVTGISNYRHDISEGNTINGLPVLYKDGLVRTCPNDTVYTNGSSYSLMGFVGCNNITVRDSSPGDAILFVALTNSAVTNSTVSFSKEAITTMYTNNTNLTNNTINANDYGIFTSTGSNNIIRNNTINASTNYGIYVVSSLDDTVADNSVQNGSTGIYISYINNSIFANNTVRKNAGSGFSISGSNNNTLFNNTITNTSNNGISFSNSANNTIINNTLQFNRYDYYSYGGYLNNTIIGLGMTTANITFKGANFQMNASISPPLAARNISKFFRVENLSTTSWLLANVSYTMPLPGGINENTLRLYRYNTTSSQWEQLAQTDVNTTAKYVWGNITQFSDFAPLGGPNYVSGCQNIITNDTYTLNQNLTGNQSSGICIDIQAPNVTLDCAGFSINSSTGGDWAYGIFTNSSNTTVQNCYVQNYGFGIYLNQSNYSSLSNNTIFNNSYALALDASSGDTIFNNSLLNSTYNLGMSDGGYAAYINTASTNNTFANNTARYNYYGVYLDGPNNSIINSTINLNLYGIVIASGSNNNSIAYNDVSDNYHDSYWDDGGYGISIWSSPNNTFINNTVNNNTDDGFDIYSGPNTGMFNNTMSDNGKYNFFVDFNDITDLEYEMDHTNLIDGNPIYYYRDNASVSTVPSDAGMVIAVHSSGLDVSGMSFHNNSHGVILADTNFSTVKLMDIYNSYVAVHLESCYHNVISDNNLTNDEAGINIYYGINNTLLNNTIGPTNSAGIFTDYLNDSTISYNTVSNCYTGMSVTGTGNTISSNVVYDNNGQGIVLNWPSMDNIFINNTAYNNTNNNLYIGNSLSNFRNNTFINQTIADVGFSYPTTVSFISAGDGPIKFYAPMNPPTPDPSGYKNISKYVNATLESGSSWLFLNVSYNNSDVLGLNKSSMFMARSNGTWETNTSTFATSYGVDHVSKVVYANITGFGSTFAPLINSTAVLCDPPGSGDWVISSEDDISCANTTITLGGNLVVNGSLTFHNVTLKMNGATNGSRAIDVYGGMFIYDNDNDSSTTNDASVITNGATPNANYRWWVWPGASFEVKNSVIQHAGWQVNPSDDNCEYAGGSDQKYCGLTLLAANANITGNSISYGYHGILVENSSNDYMALNTITDTPGFGVYIYNSNNGIIANNTRVGPGMRGIFVRETNYTAIENNTVYGWMNHSLIYLYSPTIVDRHNTIRFNNLTNSSSYGIVFLRACGNTIANNTIANAAGEGIYFKQNSTNNIIANNTVSDTVFAIWLSENSTHNNVTGNYITRGGQGIKLETAHYSIISKNTVFNSTSSNYGIVIDSGDHITIDNNNVSFNQDGIYAGSHYNTISNNIVYNNTNFGIVIVGMSNGNVSGNTAFNNTGGMRLFSVVNYTNFTNNTMYNNTYGFYEQATTTVITVVNNNASNNTEWDFIGLLNYDVVNLTTQQNLISFTGNRVALKGLRPYQAPAHENNISKYINATNNDADSWLLLNISYTTGDLGGLDENLLKIWRYNGVWTSTGFASPNDVNTTRKVVYANITSFGSIFAPLGQPQTISGCQNITTSGTWTPSANLTGNQSNGICIDVQVPNVTIDCLGQYSLKDTYNGTFAGNMVGISSNSSNTTIKNCNIENYEYGIVFNSNTTFVNNNTIINSFRGVWFYGINNTIDNNTIINNTETGIYVTGDFDNITNNMVNDTDAAIYLADGTAHHTNVSFNSINNNRRGIELYLSTDNQIHNNTINNNTDGITIGKSCVNNAIVNNTVEESLELDLRLSPSVRSDCSNVIANNTGSGDRPIMYFNSSTNLQNEVLSELILCDASNSNIVNATIAGSDTLKNDGIITYFVNDSLFTNVTSANNYVGISSRYSNNVTLENITADNNFYSGLEFYAFSNLTLTNVTANNNPNGIYASGLNNATFTDITTNNNYYDPENEGGAGIFIEGSEINLTNITANNNIEAIYIAGQNNVIVNSTFNDNYYDATLDWGGYGLYVGSGSVNTTVINNTARNNTEWDFYSDTGSTNNLVVDLHIGSTVVSFESDDIAIRNGTATSDPPGYQNISKYVNATNVSETSWLFLNVSYTTGDLNGINENSLFMARRNSTDWETNTSKFASVSGVNNVSDYVYANITGFGSTFAPLGSPGISGCMNITSTGTWNLTTNPVGNQSSGRCIDVQANDVIIDCLGLYSINGTYDGTTYGIYTNSSNTTIKNCLVQNYTFGIHLNYSNYTTLFNNTIKSSTDNGIRLYFSSYNNLTNNNVSSNAYGIFLFDYCNNNTLFNNTVNANNAHGIVLYRNAENNTLDRNSADFNGGLGINLYYQCYNNTIRNNTANSNRNTGFLIESDSRRNTLFNNTAYNNTNDGIRLDSSPNNLTNNTAYNNTRYGIWLSSSPNSNLTNNTAYYNNNGIEVDSSPNNILTNNIVNNNTLYGIYLNSFSPNNNLTLNIFNSNARGMRIESGPNVLDSNTANDNNYGIDVDSGSNNRLTNNTLTNNTVGIQLSASSNNVITNNTANNKVWDFYSQLSSPNNTVINLTTQQNLVSFTSKDIALKGLRPIEAPMDYLGYRNIQKWVNATNTSTDSWVWLNVSYTPADLGGLNDSSLRIWRHNGTWTSTGFYGTNDVDTIRRVVYANITGFGSTFAPLGYSTLSGCTNITSTGIWKLIKNLTAFQPSLRCIDIKAPNVTLDCDGFSINGTDTDATQGIYIESDNATVKNCYVQKYNDAIRTTGNSSNIQNNTLTDNLWYGIIIWKGANDSIDNNTIDYNHYAGLFIDITSNKNIIKNNTVNHNYNGIYFYFTSNNTLVNNTVNENKFGIQLQGCNNNTIINNTAYNNSYFANSYGISIHSGSNNNTIVNNTFDYNNYGISSYSSFNNTIKNNTATNNVLSGIYLNDTSNNTLTNNTAYNNNNGIELDYSSFNDIINNTGSGNYFAGILLISSSNNTLTNNTAWSSIYGISLSSSSNNTLFSSNVTNNSNGIFLSSSSNNNLTNNTANENSHGIMVSDSNDNTLINNTAYNNLDSGIYVSYSSDDTFYDNAMTGNMFNFYILFSDMSHLEHTIDTTNLVGGKPIYYYKNDPAVGTVPDTAGMVIAVSSAGLTAQDMVLYNNSHGVILANTTDSIITNMTSHDTDYGIELYADSTNNNISSNNASSNHLAGISIDNGPTNNTISNNTANDNVAGISLSLSTNNTLTNNTINANDYGIDLLSSTNNNLTNNTANDNTNSGIYLEADANSNTLTNNTANNNIQYGINLFYSSSNNITTNIFSNNSYGIYAVGFKGMQTRDNVFTNNTANNNSNWDFYSGQGSANNTANNLMLSTANVSFNGDDFAINASTNPPAAPGNISRYFNATNTSETGWAMINVSYTEPLLGINENSLKLYHYNGTDWQQLAQTGVEPTANYVWGNATSFSTFAPLGSTEISGCMNITSTGTWNLTANLIGNQSNGICIDIQADNVTLDCNGWNIAGNESGITYGIYANGRNNTTILNCNVLNYSYVGYYFENSNFTNLTNNTAYNNTLSGIYIWSSTNNTLTDNTFFNNTNGYAMRIESTINTTITNNTVNNNAHGIYLISSSDIDLYNNTAYNNTGYGININGNSNCTLTNNTAHNNSNGIFLSSSSNSTLTNNTAYNNMGSGIDLYYSPNSTLTNNIAYNNGNGIVLDSSSNSTLTNNIAYNNALSSDSSGIHLFSSPNNTLDNNMVYNNRFGIRLESTDNITLTNNTANNNTANGIHLFSSNYSNLINNTANDNYYHGIVLASSSDNNTLTNNTANNNNNYHGIYLSHSDNNTLSDNVANNNTQYGIHLESSSNNVLTNCTAYDNSWDYFSSFSSLNNTAYNLMLSTANVSFNGDDFAINASVSPPAAPKNISRYFNATNTSETGWAMINVSYTEPLPPGIDENILKLYRYSGGSWQQLALTGVNNVSNYVWGNATQFSTFAPLGDITEPLWSNNLTDPASPATYSPGTSYQFNITWTDNIAISDVVFEFAGTNYSSLAAQVLNVSSEYYINISDLAAGSYNYRWYANDTSDNWNFTGPMIYQVGNASNPVTLYMNGTANANQTYTYPQTVNATAASAFGTSYLWRNGNAAPTQDLILLGNDTHAYSVNATGDANHSDNSTGVTFYALVNKGALAGTVSAPTVTYPTNLSASSTESNTGDSDVAYAIYCDNTLVASATGSAPSGSYQLAAATYNCKLNTTAGPFNNWTVSASIDSVSTSVNQNNTNPADIFLYNGTWYQNQNITALYGTSTNANATVVYSSSGTANLYRDSGSITNPQGAIVLSAGLHAFKGNVTGNTNYSDNSTGVTYYMNITQATATCSLTVTPATPITYGTQSNASCTCTVGAANLYRNDSSANIENNVLITLPANTWNYTCNVSATTNYTSATNSTGYNVIKANNPVTLYLNGTANANQTYTYPQAVNATGVAAFGTANLYREGSSVSNAEEILLGNGTYAYKVNATSGNSNYSDNSTGLTFYALVNKGSTNTVLLLNGTDGDKTYYNSSVANFTITLNVSGKTVSLDTNISGWSTVSGVTPLQNTTELSTIGRFNITGYFSGDANYSASSATHFLRVGKNDGSACTNPDECLSGYCVHGTCRPRSPYCGDTFCDTGENSDNCLVDCPSSGGGFVPPIPPLPPPPVIPLPPAPIEWPPVIPPPIPGRLITVPQSGISILLMGNLTDNRPNNGTVAILLYPGMNNTAMINNISEIVPLNLGCDQEPLSAYEINITADVINYCMNYKGKLGNVNESTVSVWKMVEGKWQELTPDVVLKDTDIICANITSARTPYMIAGFVPVVGISPELALASIRDANITITQAELAGIDVTIARDALAKAELAYVNCDYKAAKELADRAASSLAGLPFGTILSIMGLIAAAVIAAAAYLVWRKLKKRVMPRFRPAGHVEPQVQESTQPIEAEQPTARHVEKKAHRGKMHHEKKPEKHIRQVHRKVHKTHK